MSGYLDFHTMHTIHGRALAFATGVKMGRPELTVIVPMGDGDALAIGGNHLIHAARRNVGMTAIIINNSIYGGYWFIVFQTVGACQRSAAPLNSSG